MLRKEFGAWPLKPLAGSAAPLARIIPSHAIYTPWKPSDTFAILRRSIWERLFRRYVGTRVNIEEALRINAAAGGDISKCVAFQDSAGTIPVTDVEQPLGLVLDYKTGRVEYGPELVTNGDFSDGNTGWTLGAGWSISAGVASRIDTGSFSNLTQSSILTLGKQYRIEVNVLSTSGTMRIFAGTGSSIAGVGAGKFSAVLTCDTSTALIIQAVTGSASVTNISVREVIGTHHIQPTTTKRPVVSRRVNLLTAPRDFASGAWTKNGSTTATQSVISFPVENQAIAQLVVTPAPQGASATFSVELSGTPGQTVTIGLTRGGSGAYEETTTTVTLTSEYQRYSTTLVIANANQTGFIPFIVRRAGQTALSVNARNADIRYSFDLIGVPPFQDIRSATDYDTEGFPAYAKFDGVDDFMETAGNLDLTATDEVTVLAGVAKLSDASPSKVIFEFGTDTDANNGAFLVLGPSTASSANYLFGTRGTVTPVYIGPSFGTPGGAPDKALISAYSKISPSNVVIRRNGVQRAQSTTTQGTGNYGNHKLYIGARAGTTFFFSGRIYSWTVLGKNLSPSQLANVEQLDRYLGRLW